MMGRLFAASAFTEFDKAFGLRVALLTGHDDLGAYVHTRGFRHSSFGQGKAAYNEFSAKVLRSYVSEACRVVRGLITVMLLKYPIGMQPLPMEKKFGINKPIGGYLEEYQVNRITAILGTKERQFLQELSDCNPDVQATRLEIESRPDLSPEEFHRQIEEFDRFMGAQVRRGSSVGHKP
jgi:hypothetical protein